MKKIILALFIFLFILVGKVLSQQVGLSISPPLLEVTIKPETSILIAYNVGNFGDPAVLRTRVVSFSPKDQLGNIDIKEELEGPVRFSLDNADIQMEQPFLLKSKEAQQILLRIRVPEGAPEGDYYYTLLAETDPQPFQEGNTASRAQARIGSNILITVSESGRVDIKGKISIFDTLARFKFKFLGKELRIFDSGDKVPVVLVVENSGKNVIKPDGEIVMKGPYGGKATYSILSQNILAMSQRQLTATLSAEINCDPEDVGKRVPYYCKRPASVVLSGFFLGNYRLSTSISFGEGTQNVFAETSFLALPLKFGLGLIAVLIIVAFIIKKFKNKEEV